MRSFSSWIKCKKKLASKKIFSLNIAAKWENITKDREKNWKKKREEKEKGTNSKLSKRYRQLSLESNFLIENYGIINKTKQSKNIFKKLNACRENISLGKTFIIKKSVSNLDFFPFSYFNVFFSLSRFIVMNAIHIHCCVVIFIKFNRHWTFTSCSL